MNRTSTPNGPLQQATNRRWFLRECRVGLGAMALAALLNEDQPARAATSTANLPAAPLDPLAPKSPHFAAQGQAA